MQPHDCSDIISRVFLALDGELSEREEKEFLEELDRCSCCLDNYSIEKTFKEFLMTKIQRKKVGNSTVTEIKEKIKSFDIN